ncbi:MAG: ATP-binding protein [Pseudomonadota bacterium]|nr:ATP-binding protein [Pseudomonadota bacterium]
MIKRCLNIEQLLTKRSFFLFGPRATGKSTLVSEQLQGKAEIIDLLDRSTFATLTANPAEFENIVNHSQHNLIVVDEIQLLPELLNTVQRLIVRGKQRFLLTGSSQRKLRRQGANLLAGRALVAHMLPLTRNEISGFDLLRYLHCGGLPEVYLSDIANEILDAYVYTYLQEEIRAEGAVRNLPAFSRFLQTMALANGEILNFTKLASDCQLAPSTVRDYVQVLEDTLLGALLLPWRGSTQRKAVSTAKFYFFDTGVARTLTGIKTVERNSSFYGKAFEQFIWMELRAYLSYQRKKLSLTFWCTKHGQEVDLLIGEEVAIEVKAKHTVSQRDLKGLRLLAEEGVFQKFYLVSHDRSNRRYDACHLIYWENFLDDLWAGKLLAS